MEVKTKKHGCITRIRLNSTLCFLANNIKHSGARRSIVIRSQFRSLTSSKSNMKNKKNKIVQTKGIISSRIISHCCFDWSLIRIWQKSKWRDEMGGNETNERALYIRNVLRTSNVCVMIIDRWWWVFSFLFGLSFGHRLMTS